MRDDKTEHRGYLLPHVDNDLETDVERLRVALGGIDDDVNDMTDSLTLVTESLAEKATEAALSVALAGIDRDISAIFQALDFWDLVPVGLPVMWTLPLAQIPYDKGFVLADGRNGTPNLMGRFLKSIDNAATDPGKYGGANSRAITTANLPSHNHTFTGVSHNHTGPSHTHTFSGSSTSAGNHVHNLTSYRQTGTASNSTTRANVNIGYSPTMSSYGGLFFPAGSMPSATTLAPLAPTGAINAANYLRFYLQSTGNHAHTITGSVGASGTGVTGGRTAGGSVGATGSGAALDIRPAYAEIAIIIKIFA